MRRMLVVLGLLLAVGYFLLSPEEGGSTLLPWKPAQDIAEQSSEEKRQALDDLEADAPPQEIETLDEIPADTQGFVRGRVVDLDGEPVRDAKVVVHHILAGDSSTLTTADGRFTLLVPEKRGAFSVESAGWMLVGGDRTISSAHEFQATLVLARTISVRGHVGRANGDPLAGVALRAYARDDAVVPAPGAMLAVTTPETRVISDSQGRFDLGLLPRLPQLRVEASLPGFVTIEQELPSGPAAEMSIVLDPP